MSFRRLDERPVFSGHIFDVVVGRFAGPDGSVFERDVVHHPGAVAVLPLDGDDVILVRQYRAAIDDLLIEIPAGLRDVADEPIESTARRELREEVGLVAETFTPMTWIHNAAGFSDERIHILVAEGLTPVERVVTDSPEEQEMDTIRMSHAEALDMIRSGEITDAKTVIALLGSRLL